MSGTKLSACLMLLLVAVSVHYSLGLGLFGRCTSTTDCAYEHGLCYSYKECDVTICLCQYGYSVINDGEFKCKLKKNIGESCDATDNCYDYEHTHCENNVCTCYSRGKPSEDKKRCNRRYGEQCDTDDDCEHIRQNILSTTGRTRMKCLNGKCGCASGMKHVSAVLTDGDLYDNCVFNAATMDVKGDGRCDYDERRCESGLHCSWCPQTWPGPYPKCMTPMLV